MEDFEINIFPSPSLPVKRPDANQRYLDAFFIPSQHNPKMLVKYKIVFSAEFVSEIAKFVTYNSPGIVNQIISYVNDVICRCANPFPESL